jgi:hypothetical protein
MSRGFRTADLLPINLGGAPAALSASGCPLRFWSSVETLAYPTTAISASCGLGPGRRHARDLVPGGSDPSSQAQQFGNCVIEPSSSVESHSQKRVDHRAQGSDRPNKQPGLRTDAEQPPRPVHVSCRFVLLVNADCRRIPVSETSTRKSFSWCCGRGLNSRPLPYQGSALPLSYRSKPAAWNGHGTTIISRRRRVPCHMQRGTASAGLAACATRIPD